MSRSGLLALVTLGLAAPLYAADLRAGAAAVDVTPERFPVIVNGGFAEAVGTSARDKLHARALVLDDGTTRLAIIIVDSCMMPREFLDQTKQLIRDETRIPVDRQLIAATHTHTAPAVMGCLGSDADPAYAEFLQRQLVRAARQAANNLTPAEVGVAVAFADGLTNTRRWVLRSDKVRRDPFGDATVRANMHPGYQHPDFVGPSGPTDPRLSLLAVRTTDGKPLAALANFSMHYFGSAPVSADYYGRFCDKLAARVAPSSNFVAVMSQGTSGDSHWMDYGKPKTNTTLDQYAERVADVAFQAWKRVKCRRDVTLAMAEATLTLGRRVPDADRLAWAKKRVAGFGGKKPRAQPDIYAREAVFLHDDPQRELKLQAIRVGDTGLAAIPDEVYALTGLKIKNRSPLPTTFTLELANGAEGYIPPPEQHVLGGYTTWPARTAGLEVQAEPKITEAVLTLLEKVSGRKRRADPDPASDAYARLILAAKPVAYWRLGELSGPQAADLVGTHAGTYSPGVVFGLEGPLPRRFAGASAVNRAAHFAGGRVTAKLPPLGERYSVELWYWNGFPPDVRADNGAVVSLGTSDRVLLPRKVPFRTWTHILYVRERDKVTVYTNGEPAHAADAAPAPPTTLTVGNTPDGKHPFEGRVAEVAVYDRALSAADARARVNAAK